jgi:hypothetical protein
MTKRIPFGQTDKTVPWQPETLEVNERARQFYGRLGQVRLSLDALEDKYNCTSAIAMHRITAGRFSHPGWARLYQEYTALLRNEPIPAPPAIPVDSADAREQQEAMLP